MSRAPLVTLKPERGLARGNLELVDTTIGWRFVNPLMAEKHSTESMGETAENVAERYSVSRADQDAFALESHRRAVAAADAGRFDDELVTVAVPQRQGRPSDRACRRGPPPGYLAREAGRPAPAFREGGSVTAGNSSQINDGAACLVLASEERARELGREPLARILGRRWSRSRLMGVGPVPAVRKAQQYANDRCRQGKTAIRISASCSGAWTGSERRRTASSNWKMAVLAPILRASVMKAAAVKPRLWVSRRTPYCTSCQRALIRTLLA